MSWFAFRKKHLTADRWAASRPLLALSPVDQLTIGEACEGVAILGGPGSGKTSGSGFQLAHAMLSAGFAGLVCTVKVDECERWKKLCRMTGREADLVIFDPDDGRHRFNFLADEVTREGTGAGLTDNVVNLLEEMSEVGDRATGNGPGREDDAFWRQAARRLARNAIELVKTATGTLSVPFLCEVLRDTPTNMAQARDPNWQMESAVWLAIERGRERLRTEVEAHDLELAASYFLREWPSLAEKTRSIVLAKLNGILDVFSRGKLRQLFSTDTTITPDEAIRNGQIIVVNLPLKEFYQVGMFAQTVWRSAYQRAVERRGASDPRPCFVYVDEAQHYLTLRDMHFAATARSSRCVNCWLTQNISNLYVALGGHDAGKAAADSLMGLCQTKIFHCNSDPFSNDWSASLLGRRKQRLFSFNLSYEPEGGQSWCYPGEPRLSTGSSEAFEWAIQPHLFARLRKGGPPSMETEAVVFQGGKIFNATGETYLRTSFKQGF